MKRVCNGCEEIINNSYCYSCGTENGEITEKDDAYAAYTELIQAGNDIHEARKQDCLRHGTERFQEWNEINNNNLLEIEEARKRWQSY